MRCRHSEVRLMVMIGRGVVVFAFKVVKLLTNVENIRV
jgi:hypothetical protein